MEKPSKEDAHFAPFCLTLFSLNTEVGKRKVLPVLYPHHFLNLHSSCDFPTSPIFPPECSKYTVPHGTILATVGFVPSFLLMPHK